MRAGSNLSILKEAKKNYMGQFIFSMGVGVYLLIPFCGFPGYKPVPPRWFKIVCWFYVGNTQGSPKVVLWRNRESNLRPLVYKA